MSEESAESAESAEPAADEPTVVPNRRERRMSGKNQTPQQVSKKPGHLRFTDVVAQRQFANRRRGGGK